MLQEKDIKIWDVNIDNIVISKLIETKTKVIRTFVLIMPKMNRHVKIFKVKDGDKDENNKLMLFCIDNEELLEKYKAIWTKIKDFKKH